MEEKYIQMLIEAVQSCKSAHHRIDQLNEVIKEIRADVKSTNQIAISVEKLAMEMKAMREDEQKMDSRLKQLEDKPAKNWDNLTKTIITRNSNSYFGLFFSKIWVIGGMINYEKENINSNSLFISKFRCFMRYLFTRFRFK